MIYNIMQIKMSQYGSMEYGATRGCSWILYPSRLDSVGPRKSFLMGSRVSQVLKMTVWILNINSWGIFYGHLPSSLSNFLNFENPAAAWVKRLFFNFNRNLMNFKYTIQYTYVHTGCPTRFWTPCARFKTSHYAWNHLLLILFCKAFILGNEELFMK